MSSSLGELGADDALSSLDDAAFLLPWVPYWDAVREDGLSGWPVKAHQRPLGETHVLQEPQDVKYLDILHDWCCSVNGPGHVVADVDPDALKNLQSLTSDDDGKLDQGAQCPEVQDQVYGWLDRPG